MTDKNVPNGISFNDLTALMQHAHEKEEAKKTANKEPITDWEEIVNLAHATKTALWEEAKNPLAMKMLCLMICDDMVEYHRRYAQEIRQETGEDRADQIDLWLVDCGQWLSARNTIVDVEVTTEDPTPRWKQ